MKRKKIRRNSSRNDLIDGAVDVIINTRDFVGNEKQAIRDYCFENEILDCKGFYKIAMAKANLKWNAYRRDARGLRRNSESFEGGTVLTMKDGGIDRFRLASIKQGLKARKIGMFLTRGATTAKLMAMLGEYTGVKYKKTDLDKAIADAQNLLDADVNLKTQRDLAKGLTDNRGLNRNAGRKRTWKIGEYAVGGIIEAKVNQTVTAVGIRNAEYKNNATIATRLFRWPLDEFRLEEYLNDLTTSYYASQIIDWIKGQKQNIIRGNPEGSPQVDSSPLKKLVMDLASDFAPVVKDIESSRYSTTQNNYGRYMSLISSMSKGDKKRAEIIAMALITAGANRSGVKSALRVMFGE